MNYDGFYEGRVVEAELEAIRLRKDDVNRVMFWLWAPFGPTEERERELTAPKPLASLENYARQGMLQSAYAQQAMMMQNALQAAANGYGLQNRCQNGALDALGLTNMGLGL